MTASIPLSTPIIGDTKDGPSIAGFHKIVDFMRCPQEYKFRHVLQIKPKNQEDKVAFAVGTLTHVGRATWFGSQFKCSIDAVLESITDNVAKSGNPIKIKAEREAKRLISAYVEHWRSKPLPLCRAVEYDIGPAPMRPSDPFFLYRTARFDDLSIYPDALNKLCIGDLKTTSDSISACVNEYRQHGQFILYSILYKMAKEGQQVFGPSHGIMLDICTKDAVPKFHRELIIVTPFQEQWYVASMSGWLRAAAQVTAETPTPRNVTQCSRAASRKGSYLCDFHQLCHYGGSHNNQYLTHDGQVPDKRLIEL